MSDSPVQPESSEIQETDISIISHKKAHKCCNNNEGKCCGKCKSEECCNKEEEEKMYEVDAKEYQMFLCWRSRIQVKIQRSNEQNKQNGFNPEQQIPNTQQKQMNQPINNNNSKPINPALLVPPLLNLPYCNCNALPYPPTQQPKYPPQYYPYQQPYPNPYPYYQYSMPTSPQLCQCGLPLVNQPPPVYAPMPNYGPL